MYDIPSHSVIRFCPSAVWLLCEYNLLVLQYRTIGHNLHWYITWWSVNNTAFTTRLCGDAKKNDQWGYTHLHCNKFTISKQFYFDVEHINGFIGWGSKQSRWRHSVTEPHTRWRICVTMATLWQQQDGSYMLLWKRYGNNKMAAMRYYGNVIPTFI